MIIAEVIKDFKIKDFDKLKNIKRFSKDVAGELFNGDTFECTEEMAAYLLGANRFHQSYIKIIGKVEEPKEAIEKPKETVKKTTKKVQKTSKKAAKK